MDGLSATLAHGGLVRHVAGGQAQVAVATAGCSACGHVGGCGIGKLAGRRRETLITLAAPAGLRAGERVTLELDEGQLTRAALLGYLLPVLLLLAGAWCGDALGAKVSAGGTAADAPAALGALAGLLLGLLLTRLWRPPLPRLTRAAPISVLPLESSHV